MKTKHFIFFAVLALCSCSRFDNAIDDVNDDISGIYTLSTAMWRGGQVDLNGDGNSNVDLISEFANDGNMAILKSDLGATVNKILGKDNPNSKIVIRVPLQNVYDKPSGLEVGPVMNFGEIYFDYSADKKGNLTIGEPDYSHISYDDYSNSHFKDISDARIISVQDGTIYAEVTVSYYDLMTKQFLKNKVTLSYTRVKPLD